MRHVRASVGREKGLPVLRMLVVGDNPPECDRGVDNLASIATIHQVTEVQRLRSGGYGRWVRLTLVPFEPDEAGVLRP